MDETGIPATREAEFRLREYFRRHRRSNFQRFLLFSGLMHLSVLIAGPYFLIYMLRDLQFSYLMYGSWMAAGVLGQFLTLTPWGRIGDRFGNRQVLMTTGYLVPFLPMLYMISTNFYFLLAVNFWGGVIWAGLSIGLQNYLFDSVRPEDRAKSVAVWNAVNAVGWCVGAMLGGWLAMVLPSELKLPGLELQFLSNLPLVFFISGVLRLGVSLALLRSLNESRHVESSSLRGVFSELPLVRPLTGALIGLPGQDAFGSAVSSRWVPTIVKHSRRLLAHANLNRRRLHRKQWKQCRRSEDLP